MSDRTDRLTALLDALGTTPDDGVDLVPAVLARLEPRTAIASRRRRRRRVAVLAIGVSAALLTGCMAIPAVRASVLDLLHLDGLVVRQGPLPSVPPTPTPSGTATQPPPGPGRIGTRTTLGAAEAATGGRVLVPAALGVPAEVWQEGALVDLVYRDAAGQPSWVVTEVTARSRPLLEKILGTNARAEQVEVGGDVAAWITGPQELLYLGADGEVHDVDSQLTTSSLVWARGGVTVRLQAAEPKETVLRVAASMR